MAGRPARRAPPRRPAPYAARPGTGGWTAQTSPSWANCAPPWPWSRFEPGSHALVTGGGEPRRRFVDWGLFHVEHDFLPLWRRYARALKQRNALLKAGAGGPQLDAWDHELAEAGEAVTRRRRALPGAAAARAVARSLRIWCRRWARRRSSSSPAGAATSCRWPTPCCWRATATARRAIPSVGPHRADWRIDFAALPGREALSRGQAKLSRSGLPAGAGRGLRRAPWRMAGRRAGRPGLGAGPQHQQRVLQRLLASGAQVFVTGTELPAALLARDGRLRRCSTWNMATSSPLQPLSVRNAPVENRPARAIIRCLTAPIANVSRALRAIAADRAARSLQPHDRSA